MGSCFLSISHTLILTIRKRNYYQNGTEDIIEKMLSSTKGASLGLL